MTFLLVRRQVTDYLILSKIEQKLNSPLVFLEEDYRDCNSPPQISNGYNKFSSFKHDSKVYYQCFSGYSLNEGDRMLHCNDGTWIGNIPFCSKSNNSFP